MSKRQFRSKTAYLGQPRDKGGRWAGKGSPRGSRMSQRSQEPPQGPRL